MIEFDEGHFPYTGEERCQALIRKRQSAQSKCGYDCRINPFGWSAKRQKKFSLQVL